jgi:hypothetical protein
VRFTHDGGRKIDVDRPAPHRDGARLTRPATHRAFFNANTLAELHSLEQR